MQEINKYRMQKLKNGTYVTFEGAEYLARPVDRRRTRLIWQGTGQPPEGFRELAGRPGVYARVVQNSSLSARRRVRTVVKIKGYSFFVKEEKNGFVLIETDDEKTASDLKMDNIGAGLYIKWIKLDEADGFIEVER